MCFNACTVCALCYVCWTESVGMQWVVVLCTCRRAQAWWLVWGQIWTQGWIITCTCATEANTQTHTQAHRNTQLLLHTHYNMVCVCVCAVTSLAHVHVMTQGVGVSQLVTSCVAVLTSPHHFQSLSPSCYTHCRLSYDVALLHLHWVLSHNNINRTTMQSLSAAAMDN